MKCLTDEELAAVQAQAWAEGMSRCMQWMLDVRAGRAEPIEPANPYLPAPLAPAVSTNLVTTGATP